MERQLLSVHPPPAQRMRRGPSFDDQGNIVDSCYWPRLLFYGGMGLAALGGVVYGVYYFFLS